MYRLITKLGYLFLALLVSITGLISLSVFASASTEPIVVKVTAPAQVTVGSDFNASVDIGNITQLDAANYTITFNPSVLRLDSVTSGSIGSTAIPIDGYNQNQPGSCIIVNNLPDLTGISGTGKLSILHFHVLGAAGQTSDIALSQGWISNIKSEKITATWGGTTVAAVTTPGGNGDAGGGNGIVSSGGGGGNGGGNRDYLTRYMDQPGVFSSDASTRAYDGIATLNITKGTTFKTAEGWAGSYITMEPMKDSPPPAPPAGNIVGFSYQLGPEGATFEPAITLKLIYDKTNLPQGVNENSLVIGYWDGQQWQILECTVDPVTSTISAKISHFSQYAVVYQAKAPAPPPAYPVDSPSKGTTAELQPANSAEKPESTPSASAPAITTVPPVRAPAEVSNPNTNSPAPSTSQSPAETSRPGTNMSVVWAVAAIAAIICVMVGLVVFRRKAK
jgi:hypothetical protein